MISDLFQMMQEHDFRVGLLAGLVFFILELVVIVWGIPALIDRHNEKKRLPARRIAAQRIAAEVNDLLRAHSSFDLGIAAANSRARGEDMVQFASDTYKQMNQEIDKMMARLAALGGPPAPARSDAPPPSEADKKQRAKKRLRLERIKKELLIVRNVSEIVHAFEQLERTIDTFVPILSVEMLDSVAKLYAYLAKIRKPFVVLAQLLQNPDDASLVYVPSIASIDAPDLIDRLRSICDHVAFDISETKTEWGSYASGSAQCEGMDEFLDLYFDNSPRNDRRKLGLE